MHIIRSALLGAILAAASPIAPVLAGDASTDFELAQAGLDQKIQRRVGKVHQAIDGFEATLGMDYPAEKRLKYLKQNLDSAQYEYDKIFEYYEGKFDPNHPEIAAMTERLAKAKELYATTEANKGEPPSEPTAAVPAKLDSRILYRIQKADASIEGVQEVVAAGGEAEGRLDVAKVSLAAAEREHAAILEYYADKFDLKHAEYQAALARLENARQAVARLAAQIATGAVTGAATGATDTTSPSTAGSTATSQSAQSDTSSGEALPPLSSPGASRARAALEAADSAIATMDEWFTRAGFSPEQRWQQAQDAFHQALANHAAVQVYHKGKFDPKDPDYMAFRSRLAAARDRIEGFFAQQVVAGVGIKFTLPVAGPADPLPSPDNGPYVDMSRFDVAIAGIIETARQGASEDFVQRGGVAEPQGEMLKERLAQLEGDFKGLETSGRFDPNWRDFQALKARVAVARVAADRFYE